MNKLIRGTVYPFATILCFGPKQDVIPLLRKYKHAPSQVKKVIKHLNTNPAGTTFFLDYDILLWLPKPPETILDHAVLAHEIYHVAIQMISNAGMSHNKETEEATAYLIQWLHCETYKALLTHERKTKP